MIRQNLPDNPIGTKYADKNTFLNETTGYIDKRLFKLWREKANRNIEWMHEYNKKNKDAGKRYSINAYQDLNILKGERVGIVAKGPDTARLLADGTLQEFAKKYKIIAVNVVAEDLVKHGITPWAVVVMDMISKPISNIDTKLYSCVKTNNEFIKKWKGDIKFFVAGTFEQDTKHPAHVNAAYLYSREKGLRHGIDFEIAYVDKEIKPAHKCTGKDGSVKYYLDLPIGADMSGGYERIEMPVWAVIVFLKRKRKKKVERRVDVVYYPDLTINALPMLPIGGNVASGSLALAEYIFNAKEIVFIGHDYCMYNPEEYGNTDLWYRKVWEFNVTLGNENGKVVRTNLNYYRFAVWTEMEIEAMKQHNPHKRFINTTVNGLFGNARSDNGWKRPEYMEHIELADLLKEG